MKSYKRNYIPKKLMIGWIALMAALLVGFVSYAAYTNLNSVKRVVSTQGGRGTEFSSNYLNLAAANATVYALKNIAFSESGETTTFEINICNYVHNNPSKVNENDITYALTLKLLNSDGTDNSMSYDGLSVVGADGTGYSFSGGVCSVGYRTLTGGVKSVDTFRVTVPRAFIDTVRIQAVAEPNSASYVHTDNSKLARIFTFADRDAAATTWTGGFTETTTDGYDAFNYVIKGQGKGTVTLSWDGSQLEISRIFLENNGITVTESGGRKTVTFSVDSDISSRYDIQFYKVRGGVYTDMGALSAGVTFGFSGTE
ncbi:MAG: hypothetical protein ACI4XA_07295 [Oscillospiraceae bacterium]